MSYTVAFQCRYTLDATVKFL